MTTRVCKTCGLEKDISSFYRHSCGHRRVCKACKIKSATDWAKSNKNARTKIALRSRSKTEKWKEYVSQWKRQSGDVAKRRAAKAKRTPSWLTKDDLWLMREVYSLRALRDRVTGIKWRVDHIVPLRGKEVCGLHVPENLQVITKAMNLAKNNKLHFQLKELP